MPPKLVTLELLNISVDYRNILARQKFGHSLRSLKLINSQKKSIKFDIKDVESLAKSFSNLETIEIQDCDLSDEIVFVLLSNLPKLRTYR